MLHEKTYIILVKLKKQVSNILTQILCMKKKDKMY